MRVLHIASGDLWAGAEVMLYNLVRAQRRLPGMQVAVIVLNDGRLAHSLRDLGTSTVVLPESRLGVGRLIQAACAVMREFSPDIVHTHRVKEDLIGGVAAALAGKARCVRTVHGLDEAGSSLRVRVSRSLHRVCVRRRFDATYAVSRPLAERLKATFGNERVRHIANGLDIEALSTGASACTVDPFPIRIGIVGRLVPVKRQDLFLRMAAHLTQQAPDKFRFLIYGDGPLEASLRDLARHLGIERVVHFEGFKSAMATEMRRLHLLYLTSDSEGLPMVALEAMALGVPVVAHAVGELPEVLEHGRCGTLIEVHEPASYAAAALDYLAHRAPFIERAQRARERVVRRYSAEASARAYLQDYRRVLQQNSRPEG